LESLLTQLLKAAQQSWPRKAMNPDHALSVSWATGIATETNRGLQWFPDNFWLVPTPSSIGPALMARCQRS